MLFSWSGVEVMASKAAVSGGTEALSCREGELLALLLCLLGFSLNPLLRPYFVFVGITAGAESAAGGGEKALSRRVGFVDPSFSTDFFPVLGSTSGLEMATFSLGKTDFVGVEVAYMKALGTIMLAYGLEDKDAGEMGQRKRLQGGLIREDDMETARL